MRGLLSIEPMVRTYNKVTAPDGAAAIFSISVSQSGNIGRRGIRSRSGGLPKAEQLHLDLAGLSEFQEKLLLLMEL